MRGSQGFIGLSFTVRVSLASDLAPLHPLSDSWQHNQEEALLYLA
jgi:hypothetical protein